MYKSFIVKFQYKVNRKENTCFRDDKSDKLIDRFVANLVGINQLSFLPWTNPKFQGIVRYGYWAKI